MGGVSKAVEELRLADHMIYITFPLLEDKQIFLNAVTHLGNAIRVVVKDFMTQEVAYKRVRFMPPEDLLINEFISKYSSKIGISSFSKMIKDVTTFNNVKSRSTIKLKRNDKFIVISPEYSMVALTLSEVKSYLSQAKEFVNKMKVLVK